MTHIGFSLGSPSWRHSKRRFTAQCIYQHNHFRNLYTRIPHSLARRSQPKALRGKHASTSELATFNKEGRPFYHNTPIFPGKRLVRSVRYKIRGRISHILFEGRKRTQTKDLLRRAQVASPTSAFRKMRSYVEFLTTPTADTPGTTLLLHFDNKRYLIGNISEGTQRASVQRGLKFAKVSDIFLTGRIEWKNTGGLIGVILTLADTTSSREDAIQKAMEGKTKRKEQASTKPTLVIHGGPNLTHTLATARRFVFRTSMPVETDEVDEKDNKARSKAENWGPTSSDENIKVWAMAISPSPDLTNSKASTPPTPSGGPRKRPFGMIGDDQLDTRDDPFEEEKRHQDNQVRKAVVTEMFNSEWRLDHLVDQKLSEVKMPAAIFIRDPETGRIKAYDGRPINLDGSPRDVKVLVRQPWPGSQIDALPHTAPSQEALSYIIKNHPQRGRFDPLIAQSKGVEPGPKYRLLSMGESVQAADGSIVTPKMIMGSPREGRGLAVVDLPSVDYIQGLLSRWEWRNVDVMKGIAAIVWILGPGVGGDERLKSFMMETNHLKHIVSSPDYCPNYLAYNSSASSTIRLYQLDPLRYRLPLWDDAKIPQGEESASHAIDANAVFEPAKRGQAIQLEPTFMMRQESDVSTLNAGEVWRETSEETLLLAQEVRNELRSSDTKPQQEQKQKDLPGKDVEIITLGTGSALPSKYRNVSATLVRVPGCGSYIFDCGENTLGQLQRMFTAKEVSEILRDLKAIWISHLHADHHLGITSVIKAWYKEVWGSKPCLMPTGDSVLRQYRLKSIVEEQRLFVISDRSMIQWLEEYAAVEDYGFSRLVPLSIFSARPWLGTESVFFWDNIAFASKPEVSEVPNTKLMAAMGVSNIQAVKVSHCKGARAVSVTFPDGFKFSYSGDCRPSKAFIEIGKGSTVLLHEATFDDELLEDAVAKKHSTTSEALGVGVAMGARRVLLTHFSQRYQKIPVMDAGQDLRIETTDVEEAPVALERDVPIGTHPLADNSNQELSMLESSNLKDESSVITVKPPTSTDMKFGVAFDFMRVKVGQISHLEKFTPVLLKLFELPEANADKSN